MRFLPSDIFLFTQRPWKHIFQIRSSLWKMAYLQEHSFLPNSGNIFDYFTGEISHLLMPFVWCSTHRFERGEKQLSKDDVIYFRTPGFCNVWIKGFEVLRRTKKKTNNTDYTPVRPWPQVFSAFHCCPYNNGWIMECVWKVVKNITRLL